MLATDSFELVYVTARPEEAVAEGSKSASPSSFVPMAAKLIVCACLTTVKTCVCDGAAA
ncbi:hypothetical protein D3C84_1320000 [compost metagenome]